MNRQDRSQLWILAGPGALLTALLLLIVKIAPLLARPTWVFGLCLSICLACFITYLSYKEILARQRVLTELKGENEKKVAAIRATLEEATHLYREKVGALEEAIQAKEGECEELRLAYEQVYQVSQKERGKASALHTSLEDALEQMRNARYHTYLKEQSDRAVPADLPSRYHQLRQQFDEKALILEQTRRRLFALEGQLFAERREMAEEKLEPSLAAIHLQRDLIALDEENQVLEGEILRLEEIVSELSKPKPKKASSKAKVDQMLQFQFDTE